MKQEVLSVENGKLSKNGNVIFDGLYFRIFMNEIAGIIYDDIQTKRHLNEFLLGELELESGRFFVDEKRVPLYRSAHILPSMVTLINKKSKLVNSFSIVENIFLFSDSSYFIRKKRYEKLFKDLRERLNIDLPHGQKPLELTSKDRIIVELMRAYVGKKRLVILDDLSGYLQKKDIEDIFSVLFKLQRFDMTFLVAISFEDEYIKKIDRVTAIKSNKTISLIDSNTEDIQAITRRLYFNENTIKLNTKKHILKFDKQDRPIMRFQNVFTSILKDISFSVNQGELLKIHCFDDLSCAHIVDLLKGELKPSGGSIYYRDEFYDAKSIYSAIHRGICFIEECACDSMLFHNMSIVENLGIPCGEKIKNFWMFSKYSESIMKQLRSRIGKISRKTTIKNQKSYTLLQIAYYKWLLYFPKIIVCINPFTDVDIYMREKAIDMIHQFLERGITVIIVTSNYYTANKFGGETVDILKGKQLSGKKWNDVLSEDNHTGLS